MKKLSVVPFTMHNCILKSLIVSTATALGMKKNEKEPFAIAVYINYNKEPSSDIYITSKNSKE